MNKPNQSVFTDKDNKKLNETREEQKVSGIPTIS